MNKQLNLFSQEQLDEMIVRKHNYKMVRYIGKDGLTYEHPVISRTKEQFVTQARAIWGDRYDYTDSIYTSNKEPITIYCPKHDFHFRVAMAQNHLMKHKPTGCPVCSYEEQYGKEYGTDWNKYLKLCTKSNRVGRIENKISEESKHKRIALAAERKRIKEEKKALRKKEYQERLKKKKEETKRRHELQRAERIRLNEQRKQQRIADLQASFRAEAPKAQGAGYIYKGIEQIVNKQSRVMVHCPNPDHEWHPMRVDLILQGCKCRECVGNHDPLELRCQKWIAKCIEKYGEGRYDYSRAQEDYVNNDTPVWIRCCIHNHWFQQTPDNNLRTVNGSCPICSLEFRESEGEATIRRWLQKHGILDFTQEFQLPNNDPTLPLQYLSADFYLQRDDEIIIIEYHGEQHYKDLPYFYKGRTRDFAVQQHRDRYLRQYCADNHIRLIEIPYTEHDHIADILKVNLLT